MTTPKHCLTCMRNSQRVEGCSHIDCPQRRAITAQPTEGVGLYAAGCYRVPTTSERNREKAE